MEAVRSLVRVIVTIAFSAAAILAALYLIYVFVAGDDPADRTTAMAVFAALMATANNVVGYWFGNRQGARAGAPARQIPPTPFPPPPAIPNKET